MKTDFVEKNIHIKLIQTAYIVFFVLLFPLYFINKRNFKSKIRMNPFQSSMIVSLIAKHPYIYEVSTFFWNFPMFDRIYGMLPELKGRILQVGCGTGLLNRLYRENKNVDFINLDINEKYLEYGHKKKRFDTYIHGSIYKVDLEDSAVDMVVFARCFHHIKYHKKALSECARLLKHGGTVIIFDPIIYAGDNVPENNINDAYMANSSIDGMIWRFTENTFIRSLEKNLPKDLKIESIKSSRQYHITNYNLKYPQTDALVVLKKI